MLIVISTVKKLLENLMKRSCKGQIKQNLEIKAIKPLPSRRVMVIHSVTGLVWNIYYKDESIFYWTVWILVSNVKVELNLSNYATKVDLQRATVVDTSMLAAETDLARLTAQFDKLLVDKLKNFPLDL